MADIELPDSEAEEPRYSPEEIGEAIDSLSDADFRRITEMAMYFAPRSGMTAVDLEQETFVRALGSRTCRVGTPVLAFLHGVMKSIASEAPRAKRKAQAEDGSGLAVVFVADYVASGVGEAACPGLSPENAALSGLYHSRALEKALACIEDDWELQLLVEGLFDGLRGKDLEDLLDTDTKGLAAARRRLAERLKARFPAGMPI